MATASKSSRGRNRLGALAVFARRKSGAGRIQGFVDAMVRGDTVVGWARDTRDASRRLEVQVLLDDEVVGFGIADLPRKDLLAAGLGDGRYGFRLKLAARLLDGAARKVTVCAVTERGKTLLQRGQLTIAAAAPVPAAADAPVGVPPADAAGAAAAPAPMVGAIERLNGRMLHGWAFNPDQPEAPALVEFYDDELYLGSIPADRSRPRLYEKGFPSGTRGFVFEVPAAMRPDFVDRLRGRIAGTMYDLKRAREFTATPGPTPADAPALSPPPIGEDEADRQALAPSAAEAPSGHRAPATVPVAASIPAATSIPARPSAGEDACVALWPIGEAPDGADATIASWAEQDHPAIRLVGRPGGEVPDRLRGAMVSPTAKTAVADVAAAALFVLFAPPGVRLDPALAATIAALPGFPDVIAITPDRALLPGDAARLQALLDPAAMAIFAVRADLLPGCPRNLRRDLADGLASPLRLWLAGRGDLRWQRLCVPGDADDRAEPSSERRRLAWERLLADGDGQWSIDGAVITPRAVPSRISIALWQGWDEPGLPALRRLTETSPPVPLDILVPGEGDPAAAARRLAAAEAVIAELPDSGARARIIDCAGSASAVCAALLAAADGDVVLLSDGCAILAPGDLARLSAWALHPGVGGVGLARRDWSAGATLLQDGTLAAALTPGDRAAVVSAISFGLMAIAPHKIASVGGPDPGLGDLAHTTLDLGLRLARQGYHSAVLPGAAAGSAACTPLPSGALPWRTAALLRADALI